MPDIHVTITVFYMIMYYARWSATEDKTSSVLHPVCSLQQPCYIGYPVYK